MKAICHLSNHGYVLFSQCCQSHPTLITFKLKDFESFSKHAIHIHEFGDLRDGCKSLGLHYNPYHTTHGSMKYPKQQRHAGDLINNFKTDKNGSFEYSYYDELIHVNDILGRSVVIHKGIDDLGRGKNKESLISGNAGERIACGIIGISN
jgi:Cu-Zn family superoxide dismutase